MKEFGLKEQTLSFDNSINSMIYELRGEKVMIDFELAEFYGYETKSFNQQVKRNIEKFDQTFRFKLNKEEWNEILRWKNSTANSHGENDLRSQNVTANLDMRRYLPYAFTEQGIYMLMTVLKGELATKQSILLIKTFKEMKDYIVNNQNLVSISELLKLTNTVSKHTRQLEKHEKKLKIVFDKFIDSSSFKHFLILDGNKIEADVAYQSIYSKAKKTILIVDDYIDLKTLQLLKSCKKNVKITIISDNKARNNISNEYIKDFENETQNIVELKSNNGKFHDRYIVLDYGLINEMIFHCGSSSKDSGNKITAINRIENISIYKDIFN